MKLLLDRLGSLGLGVLVAITFPIWILPLCIWATITHLADLGDGIRDWFRFRKAEPQDIQLQGGIVRNCRIHNCTAEPPASQEK